MANLEYQFQGRSIKPMVIQNDDGKYQGIVIVVPGLGERREEERFCVPTTSTSYKEALEEAKALAHKTFANKASDFR